MGEGEIVGVLRCAQDCLNFARSACVLVWHGHRFMCHTAVVIAQERISNG
jgi:hypothetical protein